MASGEPRGKMDKLDLLPEKDRSKYYQPENWGPQHQMMALLSASGRTPREIATLMDYNPATVSKILSDPRARETTIEAARVMADHLPDVTARLKFYSNEALSEIVDEMRNAEDPKVRQRAAFGILDRAGYSPVRKELRATTTPEGILNQELLDQNLKALDEAKEIEQFDYQVIRSEPRATGEPPAPPPAEGALK